MTAVRLLDRRASLIALDKPAGLPTTPAGGGRGRSLLSEAARLLGVAPGRLHAESRLDAPVSGVVLVTLDRDARRVVEAARRGGTLVRRYVALALAAPAPERGVWDAPIGRGPAAGSWAAGGRDARPARTRHCTVARGAAALPGGEGVRPALLACELDTGRTHQVRIHAAGAGAPLLGDVEHGGPRRLVALDGAVVELGRVALHAARVELPLAGASWAVRAPIPHELADAWLRLGGDAGAWASAVELPGWW